MSATPPKTVERIYEQYELGDNELLAIDARKESVCFDLHEIINNDDGWKDGFELSWKEIYHYCKEGLEAEEAEREKARLRNVGELGGGGGLLVNP